MPKVSHQKATAFFRVANSADVAIDADNQTLRGVKLMEVGVTATFKGADGKAKSVVITPEHISALLAHAGNRALPVHNTHEWFDAQDKENADSVERGARIGALSKFRKDDSGNLIADAVFKKGDAWDDVLFAATHNPEDTMFSAVFNYSPDDAKCLPLNFRCADVVPRGAATTALFSDSTSNSNTMDINELIEALKDEKVQAAVSAIIKSHKADKPEEADAEAPAAKMESAAGVTDADKKDEDKEKPALMRAAIRVSRAIKRQIGELAATETALLAKVDVKVKASETALLGKSGFQTQGGDKTGNVYDATLAKFTAIESNPQKAALAMLRKHPELFAEHQERTAKRIATFKAA